ncbi:hypothetical protein SAMN02990966_00164 [Rhodospirillales bacterium URHD0017]|nr:hypothetical protein SAMN02990966_00164 [Rhodospirillales bacterium URHD0017]
MKRHRTLSVAGALVLWAGAVNATPPDWSPDLVPETENVPGPPSLAADATWIPVEARNHVTGASGPAAVLFGIAHERGRYRPASLRVECFDGVTAVHIDADGLRLGPWAVAVRLSLDGGRFVDGSWPPGGDGAGLVLAGERAVQFASELYGKAELRLAVVRPLSVPLLFTFVVAGAEPGLHPLADRCRWSAGPAISDAGR